MATQRFQHTFTKNGKTVYREYTYHSGDSDANGWDEGDFRRNGYEPDVREYSEEEWKAKEKAELKFNLGMLTILLIFLGGPAIVSGIGILLGSISNVVYYAIAGGVGSLLLLAFICSKTVRRVILTLFIVALIIAALLIGMQLFLNGGRL